MHKLPIIQIYLDGLKSYTRSIPLFLFYYINTIYMETNQSIGVVLNWTLLVVVNLKRSGLQY